MRDAKIVAYRFLTKADFFNIYKPIGTEAAGGGQTYIDFPAGDISVDDWREFFDEVDGIEVEERTQGPAWTFPVKSLGLTGEENLTIYQRRQQSFSIASQRLDSRNSMRPGAWRPEYGFPAPADPADRQALPPGLAIYLVRSEQGEIWAGWFQGRVPTRDDTSSELLSSMLDDDPGEGQTGFIRLPEGVMVFDEWDVTAPFRSADGAQAEEWAVEGLLDEGEEDVTPDADEERISAALLDQDMRDVTADAKETEEWRTVRKRNEKAVRILKKLYGGQCQITGDQHTFVKRDGTLYSEAHHVIPLGEEGSDSPENIIIVSPLIHRMLHYAEVSTLDLSAIGRDNSLLITINGKPYMIRWHPLHARIVKGENE